MVINLKITIYLNLYDDLFNLFAAGECPGVCVADRIADYCEAYLKTPNLCKSGTKCCVSKDQYLDNPDLRILIGSQNITKSSTKPHKATVEKVSSHFWVSKMQKEKFK